MALSFGTKITGLSGIGKKRAEAFARLGIYTVEDLLYHFPRTYQNRGKILPLGTSNDGDTGAFILTVGTRPQTVMLKNRMQLTKFTAFDDTGKCTVVFFNQAFVKDIFHVGEEFRFWGKLSVKKSARELSSPVYEACGSHVKLKDLIPVYPLTDGLTQKILRQTIENTLITLKNEGYVFPDNINEETRQREKLISLENALFTLHMPTDLEEMQNARQRFIFEELYLFALGVSVSKKRFRGGNAIQMQRLDRDEFLNELSFKLTNAQTRSIDEIERDMTLNGSQPMGRLLSGDVGSGKTVCAAYAAYLAVKNGTQAALMVPTEILARQHYNDLYPLFDKFGMKTELLIGAMTATEKRRIRQSLQSGDTDFVVGTHALLSDGVEFKNPGIVITDEQHRFGVKQRSGLAEKAVGHDAHVLVMSATPIPRTLALIMYGDLELSVLDELPPNRQKVDTFLVNESYRPRLNGFIKKQVEAGHQVYIVCPMVERHEDEEDEGEMLPLEFTFDDIDEVEKQGKKTVKSALEHADELKKIFPMYNIECIHGKLKSVEKDRIMNEFAQNRINVLVTTTVIEVGMNVPNATLMIIENAERFGLSQLHQLRGRVGRGSAKSYCVLVSDSETEKSKQRLGIMCRTNDGYRIAEADLAQRGPGDFFPNKEGDARQHGNLSFRLASLCDMDMLKRAFEEAEKLLKEDPLLSSCENEHIRRSVSGVFNRLSGA